MRKILILLAVCFLFSGCMEARELKERTIIEAVGIDRDDGEYSLIFQQYQPEAGQKAGEGSGKSKPVESTGKSISEAIDRVTHYNGNPVFLGNSTYIVIGEDMAKEGILQELHYFNGENEISPTTMLVVADGSAKELLSAQAQSESGNSAIRDILKQGQENGVIGECTILNVMKRLMEEGTSPFLPVISNLGDEEESNLKITGMAVFDREKMADVVPVDEAKGILWLNDEIDRALLTVESEELGILSAEVQESKTKISVILQEGKPQFHVHITCAAQLKEVIGKESEGTLSQSEMDAAQQLFTDEITRLCSSAVQRCFINDRCDVFRFASYLKKNYPDFWQNRRTPWNEMMDECNVTIQADCRLSKTGQQAVG